MRIPVTKAAVYFNLNEESKVHDVRIQHVEEMQPEELACSAGAVFTDWPNGSVAISARQLYLELSDIGFANEFEAGCAERQFAKIDGWVPPTLKSVVKP